MKYSELLIDHIEDNRHGLWFFTVDFIDSSLRSLQYFEDTSLKPQALGVLEIIEISWAYMSKFCLSAILKKTQKC